MVGGIRAFAFCIDLWFGIFSGMFPTAGSLALLDYLVSTTSHTRFDITTSYTALLRTPVMGYSVLFAWAILWPSLLWGFSTFKFHTTIGKLLCRLVVVGSRTDTISFGQAFARELIKMLTIALFPLWIFPLLQAIFTGSTFYDQLLGTSVVRKPKMNKVQENFKKYYRKP